MLLEGLRLHTCLDLPRVFSRYLQQKAGDGEIMLCGFEPVLLNRKQSRVQVQLNSRFTPTLLYCCLCHNHIYFPSSHGYYVKELVLLCQRALVPTVSVAVAGQIQRCLKVEMFQTLLLLKVHKVSSPYCLGI